MPRVHPTHIKAEMAVSSLKKDLAEIGILADELKHDYGEDLVLQTNLESIADSFAIRVQVKYTSFKVGKDGNFSFRVSREHLWRWISHADPVLLCLYDDASQRFALIDLRRRFSLWDISKGSARSIVVKFSEDDVADNAKLRAMVWRTRIDYYSAKIAQLEATFLYEPTNEQEEKKRQTFIATEINVILFSFMRAVRILSEGKFDKTFLNYVSNAARNFAREKDDDLGLRAAFMLALMGSLHNLTKEGLPRNLMERTTDLCGHYYRCSEPKSWLKLSSLFPTEWYPFGISSLTPIKSKKKK